MTQPTVSKHWRKKNSNRLQLNTAKTEVIWFASSRRQHQIPHTPLTVGSDTVVPVCVVRDLGIHLDSDLLMQTHVVKTASSCFAVLQQIRSFRQSVSRPTLQTLVASLGLSKLDYGCADTAQWQDFRPLYLTDCSRCWTPRRDSSMDDENTTMWRHCFVSCTGCECQNTSHSGWWHLRIAVNTTRRHTLSPSSYTGWVLVPPLINDGARHQCQTSSFITTTQLVYSQNIDK